MAEERARGRDRHDVVKWFCHLYLETAGGGNTGSDGERCLLELISQSKSLKLAFSNPSNIKHCFSSVS